MNREFFCARVAHHFCLWLKINLLGLCFSVGLFAVENDAPLPEISLEELGSAISKSRERYKRGYMEAIYRDHRNTNAFATDKNAEAVMVDFHGRFSYAHDGLRWRASFDGKTYRMGSSELHPYRWLAGFDGKSHYAFDRSRGFTIGKMQAHENIPTEIFFWSSHGISFAKSLSSNDWKFLDQTIVNGYRCYSLVLERTFRKNFHQRQELTLSPRQSFLPVIYKVIANGKLSWSHELSRLKETDVGIWYPSRVVYADTFTSRKRDARVRVYDPDREFDANYFVTEVPLGEFVRDNRVGRIHLNDPWWPEASKFMRDEFDWPPVDLTPLQNAVSYVDESINGMDAKEITASQWVQGAPISLASQKGRVTLLHFSTTSLWEPNGAQTAALKEIYRVYQPHGLTVVGITPHSQQAEEVARNLNELQVPWPVCIDSSADEKSSRGQTFDAYKLKTYMSSILVDHESKVHLVKQGKLAEQIQDLLTAAGQKDVPKVSLGFVNEPQKLSRALSNQWKQWVDKAAKDGKITGKISINGKVITDCNVNAQLRLTYSSSAHSVAGTHIIPLRQLQLNATSNEDGEFEIANLCKGTYELTIDLPDRKPIKRRVLLRSNTDHEKLTVEL